MPHASQDRKPRHHPHGAIIMRDSLSIATLLQAVERYFALMHDNDVSRFDQVFASSAQLHGLRDTKLRLMSAQDYKATLASTASPKYRNAPRLEEILLIDFASTTQALVKVRVRIDAIPTSGLSRQNPFTSNEDMTQPRLHDDGWL